MFLTKPRFMSIVDKEVRARQGGNPLMPREASGLHPSWRLRHTLNPQKESTYRDGPNKKMLINDVGSRNMYENKQNHDKLSLGNSDIYVKVARILQKTANSEVQSAANDALRCGI